MTLHLTGPRGGFGPGLTEITRLGEPEDDAGIALSVLRLRAGETWTAETGGETAFLLMEGSVSVAVDDAAVHDFQAAFVRSSLFDEGPGCLHAAAGSRVRIAAREDSELTLYAVANAGRFAPRLYRPGDVPDEQRGRGLVGDACHRIVRTIFDRSTADPAADLVLGEVVTLPGRWSSYPPHHHPQPEIYHYRFNRPEGYGHAELGEAVFKVRHNDTVKIFGIDHAQVAAPGYAMYYAWVIRHLPDRPYTVPDFTPEHRWTMQPGAGFWRPAGGGDHG